MSYQEKYIKYKTKYIQLKKQLGSGVNNNDVCPICLEPLEAPLNTPLYCETLCCHHIYHTECMNAVPYINGIRSCPQCRAPNPTFLHQNTDPIQYTTEQNDHMWYREMDQAIHQRRMREREEEAERFLRVQRDLSNARRARLERSRTERNEREEINRRALFSPEPVNLPRPRLDRNILGNDQPFLLPEPIRRERSPSPIRRERSPSPIRRERSPIRRERSPVRIDRDERDRRYRRRSRRSRRSRRDRRD